LLDASEYEENLIRRRFLESEGLEEEIKRNYDINLEDGSTSLNKDLNSNQNLENVEGRTGSQNSIVSEKTKLNSEGYLEEVETSSQFQVTGGKTPTSEGL
jgi:hypothetical protein